MRKVVLIFLILVTIPSIGFANYLNLPEGYTETEIYNGTGMATPDNYAVQTEIDNMGRTLISWRDRSTYAGRIALINTDGTADLFFITLIVPTLQQQVVDLSFNKDKTELHVTIADNTLNEYAVVKVTGFPVEASLIPTSMKPFILIGLPLLLLGIARLRRRESCNVLR